MKIKATIYLVGILSLLGLASCSSSASYADLLKDERVVMNSYLSNYRVINDIPADTIFETGKDAPYYKLDTDGNVYMQVVKAGSRDNMAESGQQIYFRFMRFSLFDWEENSTPTLSGNANDMQMSAVYFNFGDYTLESSSQWGYGLQMPLNFVGIDSEVNVIIKSQYGLTDEISDVVPYVYNLRYFKSVL